MQIDPRRDGSDRRQVDMIVGVREHLIGGRNVCAAGALVRVDVACRVRVRTQLARHARPACAALLLSGLRCIGLVPARRRQRRVRRRLRRLSLLRLQLGDARQESLILREQFLDPRQQRNQQRLQAVVMERIDIPGCHPELEAPRANTSNATDASQTDAEG